MRRRRPTWSVLLALLLLFQWLLPTGASLAAASTFAWGQPKSVIVGNNGGIMEPALTFATGRTGLEGFNSDLVAVGDPAGPQIFSDTGGFLDLGAVDFDKVIPLSGTYSAQVPAVAGHVYLFRNGTAVAKFVLTQVVPDSRPYGLPVIHLKYASGTLAPGASLPAFGTVDLGRPGGDKPAAVTWGPVKIIAFGNVGGIGAPVLTVATGQTGLYSYSADIAVEQSGATVYLQTIKGGLLDLGAVDFTRATAVSGAYTGTVPAVSGHVYLYQAGTTFAKFQVIQAIPGDSGSGATVYLRMATATVEAGAPLPAPNAVDMGTQPAGQPSFTWSDIQMMALGEVGGIISPAFNFTTGRSGLPGISQDISVEQADGVVRLATDRGALIDLGSVTLGKVPPLTGESRRHLPAVPGHVYFYQAGLTVAKFQLTQIIPDKLPQGTPRLLMTYASGTIDPDYGLTTPTSQELGGWAGLPATVGAWSCLQSVTFGRVGNRIADALTFTTGQTGLASSITDIVVDQNDGKVSFKSYGGGLIDLGAVDLAKVPAMTGDFQSEVPAVEGHVYLFQNGSTVVKFMVDQMVVSPASHGVPKVALTYSATTVSAGSLPTVGSVAIADQPAAALNACAAPTGGDNTGNVGNTAGPGDTTASETKPADPGHAIVFQVGNKTALVDGQPKTMDVPPQVNGTEVMVPMRFLGDQLGASVGWNQSEQKVTYQLGQTSLTLWVGSRTALVNGQSKTMDVPPTIVGDRTLVPLKFASENMGANVRYDAKTQQVGVATGEAAAAQETRPAPKEEQQTPAADAPKLPKRPAPTPASNPKVAYAIQDTTRLVKVDLETGLFDTVFETIDGIYHFRLNPSGDAIAYEDGDGRLIWRSLNDGSETVLYTPFSRAVKLNGAGREGTRRFAAMPWSWSPDGSQILFLSLGAYDDTPTLMSISADGGEATEVGSGFDAAWSHSGVTTGDGTSLSLYPDLSLSGGRTLDYQDVAGVEPLSYMASFSGNGRYLAYVGRNGSDLFLYDVNSDTKALGYEDEDVAMYSFPRPGNGGGVVLTAKLGDLWLVTADGKRQVTQAGDLSDPDW